MKATSRAAIGLMAGWLVVQVGAIALAGLRVRISAVAPVDTESWAMAQLLVAQTLLIVLAGALVWRRWSDVLATAATYGPMWAVAGLLAGVDVAQWWIGAAVVMGWHVGIGALVMGWRGGRVWIACIATLLAVAGPAMVYLGADAGRDVPIRLLEMISPVLSAVGHQPMGLILPGAMLIAGLALQFSRRRGGR